MVDALKQVMQGESLSRERAGELMEFILQGRAHPEQIGALLIALQLKQETVEELVGFVETLRRHAKIVESDRADLVDTCGTGGDGARTFNISTTVAFVAAAAGQPIAKHGNRAVSSLSGSFDVLEQLGIHVDSEPENVRRSIDEHGLGFMFAPAFHPALKDMARLRRNLGVRTVFNLLGPLLNPAGVKRQLVGVFSASLVEKVAFALQKLGSVEAMVVRGEDGLDEITLTGPTRIAHLKDGAVRTFLITPEEFGLRSAPLKALEGSDARENARILELILQGESGPRRDIVLLNTAAALIVGGRASDFKEGLARAADAIDSGRANRLLQRLRSAVEMRPGA